LGSKAGMLLGALLAVCGCDGSDTTAVASTGSGGSAGGEPACAPGELTRDDGSCQPAGIPPGGCAPGFVESADGCEPVLPAASCPPGQLAVPGDRACHEPMPCGSGTWGDIPVEPDTQHVDAAYAGGQNDGSPEHPWTTIADGLAAAAPMAIVAVAAGTYQEDVVLQAPVRLWGRCPAMVEIVGQTADLVGIAVFANFSEVHGVAVSGIGGGITASGALGVVVDRVHVHDTHQFFGVGTYDAFGPTEMVVRDSLVEHTAETGVGLAGGELTLERCLVRDPDAGIGNGLRAVANPLTMTSAHVTATTSVFERDRFIAFYVGGAAADLDGIVVRDTQPSAAGDGGGALVVRDDVATGLSSTATLARSLLEGSSYTAAQVASSELTITGTVIRDTSVQPVDGTGGSAVSALPDPNGPSTFLTVRESMLLRNHFSGVLVAGVPALLEAVVLRGVEADAAGSFGRGVNIEIDPVTGSRADAELAGLVIEDTREVAVALLGVDASLDGVAIRGVRSQDSDGLFGRGISVAMAMGAASSATIARSSVDDARDAGIHVSGATATIDHTSVVGTATRDADGQFGDGIAVDGEPGPTNVTLLGVTVRDNVRAGVGNFAAGVTLTSSAFSCNLVDLNGEALGASFTFEDLGGNACGCAAVEACKVLSSNLEPPAPAQ
jgi:uncharacterized protein DUF1565